jgi:two-component system, OmpR family, sensor histidine kinase BaeS
MHRGLSFKFLILLIAVAAVALSGTLILRELMLRDFREYLEGNEEDRVYGIAADLESGYDRYGGWNPAIQGQNAVSALTLGFEMRLLDSEGRMVVDTRSALETASQSVRKRIDALSQSWTVAGSREFVPYDLFLRGKKIGTVEVRALKPAREALFVRRADRFLGVSVLIVGAVAVMLSVLFSRRLTRPIGELSSAALEISRGRLGRRVSTSRRDELGGLAEAFNRMAEDLETQETLRRRLLADVAHELRTPLTVMRGELEGLIDGVIPIDENRIQSLYEETGRLKTMVEGIEDLNRAEASALSLRKQDLPLGQFLADIVERFKPTFAEKRGRLELHCPDELRLFADPDRLSQVIINLLSNALKAAGTECRVVVSATQGNGELQITVEDNGIGIKGEDLPFIFERFYRGPGGGLGIGLTIAKELVEAHGGRIEVKSAEGCGALFSVSLPVAGVHNSS